MLALAVSKLRVSEEDLVVAILREHETKYQVQKGLEAAFGRPIRTVVIEEPTRSQPETVARTLEAIGLQESFLVKDSDNTFAPEDHPQDENYVCVDSLNNYDMINPRNKSYLQVDHKGVVTNIREKVVISDLFSVGGYGFARPAQFLEYYERLVQNTAAWERELYTSDIIGAMILDGIPFRALQVAGYQDWGTITDWRRALVSRACYFVSLDGFVFERGSEHFAPRFADVAPNPEAIAALRELSRRGNTLVFLSIRPRTFAELTEQQLSVCGLEGQVVYGCPVASWNLITAPHPTLPFQTSRAVEQVPQDPNLITKILGESGSM